MDNRHPMAKGDKYSPEAMSGYEWRELERREQDRRDNPPTPQVECCYHCGAELQYVGDAFSNPCPHCGEWIESGYILNPDRKEVEENEKQ